MRRYPGHAESSPDAEPPDRIHYLLPDGCGDITDAWAREKEKREREKEKERSESMAAAPTLELLLKAWSQHPQNIPLPKMVVLPQAISASGLAEKLGVPQWLVLRVLMELKKVAMGQALIDSYLGKSLLDFEVARQVCNVFAVTAYPEEKKGTA